MIEKKLKTLHGKLSVKIPTELKEVTIGQMMALQEQPNLNDLDAISILSGIPVTELNNVSDIDNFQLFAGAILSLSHQIKHLYNSDAIPRSISLFYNRKTVTVKVMNNLSVEPAGAFMAARETISDEISEHIKKHGDENWKDHFNPSLKACCHILSQYLYCRVTGKPYNEYEAEAFCEEIKKLGVAEALPIAKHFFTCYPGLSKQKTGFLSLSSFLSKIWTEIKSLFSGMPAELKTAIHIGVLVTENVKNFVDSPAADILTTLIPGDADDEIKDLLRAKLPAILTELKLADNCSQLTDPAQITACAIKVLQGLDGDIQSSFLHSLSILVAQVAADGKLSWSDGVYLMEWYYQQEYKAA